MIFEDKTLGNKYQLKAGDCLNVLRGMADNSVDSVVTDPPYGLSFMEKKWDYDVPSVEVWREVLRVLKPGGHALIACGTRTQHRMAVAIEDAGFEIRDVITWLYGSGFPKSLDVSKAIDKAAGIEGPIVGKNPAFRDRQLEHDAKWETAMRPEFKRGPGSDAAKQWQGWGTALKPACEFWTLARKPISEKTVAANVLKWGTGAINVDASRVGLAPSEDVEKLNSRSGDKRGFSSEYVAGPNNGALPAGCDLSKGRFPANLVLSHSPNCTDDACDLFECPVKTLDEQSGILKSGSHVGLLAAESKNSVYGKRKLANVNPFQASQGGASRFFYCAKASKSERNAGCEGLPDAILARSDGAQAGHEYGDGHIGLNKPVVMKNIHPTVKPIKLMSYLVRMITPSNGTVLDPFLGSGSTGVAAVREGFRFIGIEREPEYVSISKARLEHSLTQFLTKEHPNDPRTKIQASGSVE